MSVLIFADRHFRNFWIGIIIGLMILGSANFGAADLLSLLSALSSQHERPSGKAPSNSLVGASEFFPRLSVPVPQRFVRTVRLVGLETKDCRTYRSME